ncbi:WD repeat-containing protein [Carpediemonas membranifera]|uniref:WD repeat-containing protein n=1 Tax=Carpediemonas membranifera TaxID=201153 RepID=A0A8J6BC04_9EUKA|nr:WD repeat-containing protein [Carpediemonas membranifera]|eukprot:KAG9394227.1 WD repeat-containing protein [Carpediemonas membranifera]
MDRKLTVCSSIIPAGVQQWNPQVVASTDTHFAYAATLAVYIFKSWPYPRLHRIIAAHERTITSLAWNPHDNGQIVTSSYDGKVIVWDVESVSRKIILSLPSKSNDRIFATAIEWNPFNRDLIGIATNIGIVFGFNISTKKHKIMYTFPNGDSVTSLQWNKKVPCRIAAGSASGAVVVTDNLFDGEFSKPAKIFKGHRIATDVQSPVIAVRWDLVSEAYLLVAHQSGQISMFDAVEKKSIQTFNKVAGGISGLCWTPDVSGGFFTLDRRSGILREWNVSQRTSLHNHRVAAAGGHSLGAVGRSQAFIGGFNDGSVVVYESALKKAVFTGQPNHTETIFDIQMHPAQRDILASVGYDSTLRVWDLTSMQCVKVIAPPSLERVILYSVSWDPSGERRVVVSTSNKTVVLIDVDKGVVVRTLTNEFNDGVLRVVWTKHGIAACSRAGEIIVMDIQGTIKRRYTVPHGSFGVDWSPFFPQIAVACGDGAVRIFDVSSPSTTHIQILRGHKDKTFGVSWSPLVPHLLAVGSDDGTATVWQGTVKATPEGPLVQFAQVSALTGHTDKVRPVVWSPELPNILYTGAWDATLRTWDAATGKCLDVAREHHADIYGLSVHPQRPFMMVSSSRDMSIRSWSLTHIVDLVKASCLHEPTLFASHCNHKPRTSMSGKMRLCGALSKSIVQTITKADHTAAAQIHVLDRLSTLFSGYSTVNNIWDILRHRIVGASTNSANAVVPGDEHFAFASCLAKDLSADQIAAKQLHIPRSLDQVVPTRVLKRDERASVAANLQLLLGETEAACEALIKQGRWERALSLAPAAGIEYWQGLAARYASHLRHLGDIDAAPYAIAAGKPGDAIDLLSERKDVQTALLISSAADSGRYHAFRSVSEPVEYTLRPATLRRTAQEYISACEPFLAASAYLDGGHFRDALSILCEAGEPILAASVATILVDHKLLSVEGSRPTYAAAALHCEQLQKWRVALDFASLAYPESVGQTASRLVSHPTLSQVEIDNYLTSAGMPGLAAQKFEGVPENPTDINRALITTALLAQDVDSAREALLRYLSATIESPDFEAGPAGEIIRSFVGIRLGAEPLTDDMVKILALSSFVCGLEAVSKHDPYAANLLLMNAVKVGESVLPQPVFSWVRVCHEALNGTFKSLRKRETIVDLPPGIDPTSLRSIKGIHGVEDIVGFNSLLAALEGKTVDMAQLNGGDTTLEPLTKLIIDMMAGRTHRVVCIPGMRLPGAIGGRRVSSSLLSRSRVSGHPVVLSDRLRNGEVPCISEEEFVQWTRYCPFSPLNDGKPIHQLAS